VTAAVVTNRCQGCGACLLTCPDRAIRPAHGPARLIVLEKLCTGCGECVEVCPVDAIDLARLPGEIDLARLPGETGEET
jgi:Pyruvate/2-oxoacid:ferredoxin oxidoreductase delta subunit